MRQSQLFGQKIQLHARALHMLLCLLDMLGNLLQSLHMALSGIREISIISTAPADRLAIRTIVARESDDLIRDGIQRRGR